MYRAAASLASKARIAGVRGQQVGSILAWNNNYAAKDIRFGVEAPALMMKGVEELADAVKVTMGPKNAQSSHSGGLGMYDISWPARTVTTSNGFSFRCMTTASHYEKLSEESSASLAHDDLPQRIKVKRLDKTARNIMNILDKEALKKVNTEKDIPDVRAGYIIELKVEAPENKGRISTIKGLVIGRKNAGISTSIRVRRMESNVGVETVFPLYSPNIKSLKVLEKRSVRRAKLFYIRDRPFNVALRELAQRTAKKKDMILKGSRLKQSKK